jgi:hypothetical protein
MTTPDWQIVPRLVKLRFQQARDLQCKLADYECSAIWYPADRTVLVKLADSEVRPVPPLPGVRIIRTKLAETPSYSGIRIKCAGLPYGIGETKLSDLGGIHTAVGNAVGGPSAFSNALVSGAIGAGGGYLAGTLMSNFLPEEYVRGKELTNWLALAGGLGGAAMHVPEFAGNMGMQYSASKGKSSNPIGAAFTPNAKQPLAPNSDAWRAYQPNRPPSTTPNPMHKLGSQTGIAYEPIPVDAFNNAIWRDTGSRYGSTPPAAAAATSGMLTGIQQMYGGTSVLTPQHIMHGMVAAGSDYMTARAVGGTLGAMGVLTPKAQDTLQTMGLWGGLIRGVASSVFNL